MLLHWQGEGGRRKELNGHPGFTGGCEGQVIVGYVQIFPEKLLIPAFQLRRWVVAELNDFI